MRTSELMMFLLDVLREEVDGREQSVHNAFKKVAILAAHRVLSSFPQTYETSFFPHRESFYSVASETIYISAPGATSVGVRASMLSACTDFISSFNKAYIN